MKSKLILKLLFFFILLPASLLAQTSISSDDLFAEARKAAFDSKDYPKAIALSKKALEQSPDYNDIRVFLGRVYTWSDKLDSARTEFRRVLEKHPDNEDAAVAYTNLEYWNDQSPAALNIAESGLKYHPESKELLLLQAKLLADLRRYEDANEAAVKLLKKDPSNTQARALAERIRDNSAKNKVGVSYDFVHFDKQFSDPWQLASIDYGRSTRYGSITGRINYANRFASNGLQYELEAYPRISKTFYAYVGGAYSHDAGIFPKFRSGVSLYANLPAAFEAEAGFRYLHFSDNTWVYTLSAGKYYKNYWFNFRTYLTPSFNDISQSYSLNVRYYYGAADDYFSFGVGTGISPDDPSNNILLNTGYKLHSNNVSAGFRHVFKNVNVISINASWLNQEYRLNTRGNQLDLGIGYQRRF